MAIHRHCLPSENQAINVRAKGWALRKDRKVVRFSEKVKPYLRGMLEAGAHSGNKINSMDVARNMRVCVDEDGICPYCIYSCDWNILYVPIT